VAVGILIEAEDTPTAGESTQKKAAAAGSNPKQAEAMLTGSSAHRGRWRSDGVFVRVVEVGCNRTEL